MARTPEQELAEKLRLERTLKNKLRSTYAQLGRILRIELQKVGIVPDLCGFCMERVTEGYVKHYEKVGKAFAGDISDQLPEDLRATDEELETIRALMAEGFAARAEAAAVGSLTTMQKNATKAKVRADRMIAQDQSGRLTSADAPRLAQQLFLKRQRPNAATSARMETQYAAEAAKGIEVAVLLGELPEAKRDTGLALKVWRSMGDSRVRTIPKDAFDHLEADGQQVASNQPFWVSGQALMWPGDLSMGASIGNVANCRCSAIYMVDTVAELRRALLDGDGVPVRGPSAGPARSPFRDTESEEIVGIPMDAR